MSVMPHLSFMPPIWQHRPHKNVARIPDQEKEKKKATGYLKNPRERAYVLKYMFYSRNSYLDPHSERVNSCFIYTSNKHDFSGLMCLFCTSK